jgi:protoporphyrinogen/coproporphyrinogen III oxidase
VSATVVVIGGGISGLVAARALAGAGLQLTVLEATGRWGGKINSTVLDGIRLDVGAESLLARRPEGLSLIESLDLNCQLVHPSEAKPELLVGGRLYPMPRSVAGIPTNLERLDGVLSAEGLARARSEPTQRTAPAGDLAIGRHVDERLGPEVTDRLVEPFLGGVYAGQARELSFAAVAPELYRRVRGGGSLVDHARAVADARTTGPVFAGLVGGLGGLVDALVSDLERRGVSLQLATTVRALNRIDHGYELHTKSGRSMNSRRADAVVIAVPWPAAARILAGEPIAGQLAAVPYASMAVVTMIVRGLRTAASGLLAPPGELPTIKAVTCSSIKWHWLADLASSTWGSETTVVRASVGRLGEEQLLQVDDATLLARTFAEARRIPGWEQIGLVTGHVQRWGGALPQYLVGHLDRVARVRRQVDETPRLALCGAALEGIGIAACVGSGSDAAAKIISDLGGSEPNRPQLQESV